MGFSSELSLQCRACDYSKTVHTSPKTEKTRAYIINSMMTVLAHELGVAHTGLEKIAKVIGMHNMHPKAYQSHDRRVSDAEFEAGKDCPQLAYKIWEAHLETNDEEIEPHVLNIICVSYDGTWMKRGFTSQFGVGVAIDILTGLVIDYEVMSLYYHGCIDNKTWTGVVIDTLTGLVIDYEVMSLYCHGCIDNKTWTGVAIDTLTGLVIDYEVMSLYCHGCVDNKTWTGARERLAWEEAHAADCCIKYAGSFKSMETEAAKRIWSRSVDKYKLRYTEMLSNSDTTTFKAVKR